MPDEQDETPQKKQKNTRDLFAPKPGRKRGTTKLHKLLKPEHLEEVHERLIWDCPDSVRAYIGQLGYVDEEGQPLISVYQLYYYRRNFISAKERIGAENIGKFLQEFRIKLDTLALQEAITVAQTMRVQWDIGLERSADETTIASTTANLDLLHQLIRTLYKMKQEAGLIPQPLPPIQRLQLQADVQAQTEATVESKGEVVHKIDPKEGEEIIKLLKKNLKAQSLKAKDEENND